MSEETYDNNTLAVIGAIILCWASIEKSVAGAVRWTEVGQAMAQKKQYATYVDLSNFRSFKERKGHLRGLVEIYGTKDELRNLDKIYSKLTKPNKIRHALCHDLVNAGPDGSIYITKFGNFAKGESAEVMLATFAQLEKTLEALKPLSRQIIAIGDAIYDRLKSRAN